MTKKMRTILFSTTMIAFLFTGCGKEPNNPDDTTPTIKDGKLTAKVVNGNDYNSIVSRVVLGVLDYNYEIGERNFVEFASGNYANGGFTITLPQTVDNKYLRPFTEMFLGRDDDYFTIECDDITISDVNALSSLGNSLNISGFDANGEGFDFLICAKIDNNSMMCSAMPIYVDRDVTITGEYSYSYEEHKQTITFSLSLKKGWNMVYAKSTETFTEIGRENRDELSTKAISGLKWYFYNDPRGENYTSGALDLNATVENGNAYNSQVSKVVAYTFYDNDYGDEHILLALASGNYNNGGFSLKLPGTFNPFYSYVKDFQHYDDNIHISDRNARALTFSDHYEFEAFDNNGKFFDKLRYVKSEANIWTRVEFWIADRDFTITGSDYNSTYDMSLKKGCNIVYVTYASKYEYTTIPVNDMKWYFKRDIELPIWLTPINNTLPSKKDILKNPRNRSDKMPTFFNRALGK